MRNDTALQRDPLVGREHELAELTSALRRARDGSGGVYLIAGEPGIGKTRIARAVGEAASALGATAVWGRCWETGGAPAYWPWTEVLRAYADEHGGLEQLQRLAGATATSVGQLLPELVEGDAPVGPVLDDARFALFGAVARLLRRAARLHPLVLLLDDLHAADVPSLLLLTFVARQVPSEPLLVVGTYRDVEVQRSPAVAELLAEVSRSGHTIPLRGLDRQDVGELIGRTTCGAPSQRLVAAVHEATNGNPFFVDEVLRLLRSEGRLGSPAGDGRPLGVPAAVKETLHKRLALLPDRPRVVLETAAVLGREFRVSTLETILGQEAAVLREDLAAARAVGIVRLVQHSDRFAFVHALMQEALYEGLTPGRSSSLHAAAVAALDSSGAARSAELAHHAVRAVDQLGPQRCLELLVDAAEEAMAVLAYERAVSFYTGALDLRHGHLPEVPVTRLLLGLAEARSAAGTIEAARATCLEVAEVARASGDREAFAAAALTYAEPGLQGGLVNDQVVQLLEESLRLLPVADSPLRCRVMARLALELYFSERLELREQLSGRALEMAERLADPASRAAALRVRFMATWAPDNPQERLALADELKELAQQARDPQMALHAEARRITCLLELARVTELDAAIEAHRAMAEQLGQPFHLWTSKTILAMRSLMEGRFEDTKRLAGEGYEIGWERMQQPNALFAYFNQQLSIAYELGELEEQLETLRNLAAGYPRLRALPCLLAVALVETGRPAEGQDRYAESLSSFGTWPRDSNWLHATGWLASCAWVLQDADAAVVLYEALRPHAGRISLAGMPHPVSFWGSTSRSLGLMATLLRRWDDAERHFQEALEEHRLLGARGYTARGQLEYAQMLLARDAPGDRARAAVNLGRAAEAAASMGMRLVADTAAALTGQEVAGARVVNLDSGRVPPRLVREGDVWAFRYSAGEVRIRASRGLDHIARLVLRPGHEVLAIDLMSSQQASPADGAADGLHAGGDGLGPALDPQAKLAYQRRLEALREELEEAERWGSAARADTAQAEIDALAHELAAAVGLRGRDRPVGSDAERARIAVTKAVRSAIRRISEVDPLVGRYLKATIRTGTFCSYLPDPGNSLLGELQIELNDVR